MKAETIAPTPTTVRRWVFRLLAITLTPALLLLLLEVSLRLAGLGYATGFFVPCESNGKAAYCTNPRATWRFFSREAARKPIPAAIDTEKPEGTYRIFVLGASAAQGDPYPAFGFGRILELMLEARYPAARFEVINAALTAINSHVVLEIARDCIGRESDLFVVYVGNNEVIGPYGAGTVFSPLSPNLSLIRAAIRLQSTRIGQVMIRLARWVRSDGDMPKAWRGLEMFAEQQVRLSDPRMELVYEHFRRNLEDICHLAHRAETKVVLCTVGSNLGDCPPFASLHRPDMTPSQRKDWDSAFEVGVSLEAQGEYGEAVERYLAAAGLDDRFAELSFRLARCYRALGRHDAAVEHYVRARDLDTLRFRADTRINKVIRDVVEKSSDQGVNLVDTLAVFEDGSPNGIPETELFLDHVHMTFTGNYLLAQAVFERIDAILPDFIRRSAAGDGTPLTKEECAGRLAFTGWDRYLIAEDMLVRMKSTPFTGQIDHNDRLNRLRRTFHELKVFTQPGGLGEVAARYRDALSRDQGDVQLRFNYAQLLTRGLKEHAEAARQLQMVLDHVPYHIHALRRLVDVLAEQGKTEEAIATCAEALAIDPSDYRLHLKLGRCKFLEGKLDEAVASYKEALRFASDSAEVHSKLGNALKAQGRLDEAAPHFAQASRIDPSSPNARMDLADVLFKRGSVDEAAAQYEEVLRLEPDLATAHHMLGMSLEELGRIDDAAVRYAEAVRLKPGFFEAHHALAGVLERQGRLDQAAIHYAEAVRLKPDSAMVHHQLATVLTRLGEYDGAIEHLAQTARLRPGHFETHMNLGALLYKEGRFEEAAKRWSQAVRLRPNQAEVRRKLAAALFRAGQVDEAIVEGRRAVRLEPSNAANHRDLGLFLNQRGQKAEAVEEFREALRLDPSHEETREMLDTLLYELNPGFSRNR